MSLKDELSLTHTCSFSPHTLSVCSLCQSLCFTPSLTPTHISCCPSQFPSSLLLFCSFTFLYAPMKGAPPLPLGVFLSGGAYISQRALLLGLWKVVALEPKVPSFILFNFSQEKLKTLREKRNGSRKCAVGVCACVCVRVFVERGDKCIKGV